MKTKTISDNALNFAKESMISESSAISRASARLNDNFLKSIELILNSSGKVVVTGLGKSGHIARKIAATLASTGTPAFFVHPSEAMHGDMGVISRHDIILALAFGGETEEVLRVCQFGRRLGNKIIAITGKGDSSLARLADYVLDGSIDKEVCPLNLAPTASTAVALALGDAIAVCLMKERGFSETNFAELHPAGSLGRRLSLVSDVMRIFDDRYGPVTTSSNFHEVLEAVTSRNYGIVPVVDQRMEILGAISDGDIRRALIKFGGNALSLTAKDLMSPNPKLIEAKSLALDAFELMEKNQITSVFVIEDRRAKRLLGIVRMHDLIGSKIV